MRSTRAGATNAATLARNATLAVAALVLAGCASTVSGHGSGGSASSASSGFPSSSASSSLGSASSSSASGGGGPQSCSSAAYCDDFSNASSGWPVDNKPHFYANYDTYLGGTYRIGERNDATVSEDAPAKASSISADFSVRLDVDAVLGQHMAKTNAAGMVCWEHTAKDQTSSSAFLFTISGDTAEVGLWDNTDGTYHVIQSKASAVLRFDGSVNHITITCKQDTSTGTPRADLSMTVNGQPSLQAGYASNATNFPWTIGDGIGVVASGNGADIFYDNFGASPMH